jgi:calcium-dependent protein kinase
VSKKDREEYLQVFTELDTDNSGALTRDEFKAGADKFFGEGHTPEQVTELYNAADLNNDGTIQYAEFIVAAMKQEELHSEKKLKDAFNAFDKDGNGSIDKHELMTVFEFSEGFDISEIEKMIKDVD